MKQAKYLGKTLLSFFLIFCLSACTPSKIELSPEESHAFCEKYSKEVDWIKTAASGPGYVGFGMPLERIAKYDTPFCLFEITSVEPSAINKGQYWLHLLIHEVYSGDASIKGEEMVLSINLKSEEDAEFLVGKRYIGYLLPQKDLSPYEGTTICFSIASWIFLVTEDNRLVGGYGCQLEDASQIGEDDPRSYTGQTLDYFVSKVKEAETHEPENEKEML